MADDWLDKDTPEKILREFRQPETQEQKPSELRKLVTKPDKPELFPGPKSNER